MRSLIPSLTAWDFFCAAFLVDCCLLQALIHSKSTSMIEQANDNERRFLKKLGIELIEADLPELLSETAVEAASG